MAVGSSRALRALAVTSLVAAVTAALLFASTAAAHSGGKAEPRIAAGLRGSGLEQTLNVRLTDVDDGDPIEGATVHASASMTRPHAMQLAPVPLEPKGGGLYSGQVVFVMPSVWTVRIAVSGNEVVPASASLRTRVTYGPVNAPSTGGETRLPTVVDDTLTGSDYESIAVLWLHAGAAMAWILAVVVMTIALATDPAIVSDGLRQRLSRWYRRVGVWLHWALVPVIVLTGIYNIRRVTPFDLGWTPSGLRRVADVPYGTLYESILVVKLALFAVLLVSATFLLLRTTRPRVPRDPPPNGALAILWSALGVEGVVYLATVPLIVAAASALRYVHILNHVAVVLSSR